MVIAAAMTMTGHDCRDDVEDANEATDDYMHDLSQSEG